MWKINFSTAAARDLHDFSRKDSERIIKKLKEAAKDPYHYFDNLVNCDEYKLRIGDYRAIALLDYDEKLIFILKIGHRKNIYKKLFR